jgi:hypothetical protein
MQPVEMIFPGASGIKPDGLAVVLSSGKRTDTNTITEPAKIFPQIIPFHEAGAHYIQDFPALSVTVLQLETGVTSGR